MTMRIGWVIAVVVGSAVAYWLGTLYTRILMSIP